MPPNRIGRKQRAQKHGGQACWPEGVTMRPDGGASVYWPTTAHGPRTAIGGKWTWTTTVSDHGYHVGLVPNQAEQPRRDIPIELKLARRAPIRR